ncbi:hypothetical protein RSOLAG1IB_01447 [Rhizoctonia solani AG-1 IB]|uniref:Uncharacterized protein n=1 Tax=Thanatephorus cucumeris (strain AG1-IB / isolate 7/3/14) TaxID=1108050 RepID=A0A0B7FBK2_THACB|nr:hypothetical protein RSOLAG1IB_01447 [Rhizoctonia solani AG-1 IB]
MAVRTLPCGGDRIAPERMQIFLPGYKSEQGTALVPSVNTPFRQKSETPTSDSSVESGRPYEASHPDRPFTVAHTPYRSHFPTPNHRRLLR